MTKIVICGFKFVIFSFNVQNNENKINSLKCMQLIMPRAAAPQLD